LLNQLPGVNANEGVSDSANDYIQDAETFKACVANAVAYAKPSQTIASLRQECEFYAGGLIDQRNLLEKNAARNPFAILPHRPNYVLPISYSKLDSSVYESASLNQTMDNLESEFQISLKFLAAENVLFDHFNLEFAFTSVSWWQTYNGNASAPFRETNYEPEAIFRYIKPWTLFDLPVRNAFVSLNHQSNGKSGLLSRSWNRVIGGLAFQHEDLVRAFSLWWRYPEDLKTDASDPSGDDNPDIERYVGQGQIGLLWKPTKNHSLRMLLRNNLRSNNRGSLKLNWTFPFSNRLRGFVQVFTGYGESLISYDKSSSRYGLGLLLTDWL
jgi:phospholipase A1